jgi:hypothetical protein
VDTSASAEWTCSLAAGSGSLCIEAQIPVAPPPVAAAADIKTSLNVSCVRWNSTKPGDTAGNPGAWSEAGCLVENVMWNYSSSGRGGSNRSLISLMEDKMTVVCRCSAAGLFKALYPARICQKKHIPYLFKNTKGRNWKFDHFYFSPVFVTLSSSHYSVTTPE